MQGLIFAGLKSRITTGPLVETLNYFEIHLSAQVKWSFHPISISILVFSIY